MSYVLSMFFLDPLAIEEVSLMSLLIRHTVAVHRSSLYSRPIDTNSSVQFRCLKTSSALFVEIKKIRPIRKKKEAFIFCINKYIEDCIMRSFVICTQVRREGVRAPAEQFFAADPPPSPPSKGGPRKNIYTKSERLTL